MSKYIQTEEDLLKALKDQIDIMQAWASTYDGGLEPAAKGLATHIRVLVHDTNNSRSLLGQLNKKDIKFYDSALTYNPILRGRSFSSEGISYIAPPDDHTLPKSSDSLLPYSGLTIVRFSAKEASYIAPLDSGSPMRNIAKKISFQEWWVGVHVIRDKYGCTFARKDLVLEVADTDGGAHIDPCLKANYANLSRFNSVGWIFVKNDIKGTFKNSPVSPSIRQITHEVLEALKDEFPTLFDTY